MEVRIRKGELENICDSFLENKIHPNTFLLDFLPVITTTTSDQRIFESWKNYFKEIQTSYIITKIDKGTGPKNFTYKLWKEMRV